MQHVASTRPDIHMMMYMRRLPTNLQPTCEGSAGSTTIEKAAPSKNRMKFTSNPGTFSWMRNTGFAHNTHKHHDSKKKI